jgi:hypothetical protein
MVNYFYEGDTLRAINVMDGDEPCEGRLEMGELVTMMDRTSEYRPFIIVQRENGRKVQLESTRFELHRRAFESQAIKTLRKQAEGWKEEAIAMRASRDACLTQLDLHALHQRDDVWYWQGDGTDHPESISNSMAVVIRGDQLREILSNANKGFPTEAQQTALRDAANALLGAGCAMHFSGDLLKMIPKENKEGNDNG